MTVVYYCNCWLYIKRKALVTINSNHQLQNQYLQERGKFGKMLAPCVIEESLNFSAMYSIAINGTGKREGFHVIQSSKPPCFVLLLHCPLLGSSFTSSNALFPSVLQVD